MPGTLRIFYTMQRMLYAINDRVNRAIHKHLQSEATAVVYPGGSRDFPTQVPFVQCMEIEQGLVISKGQDDYLPSSTLHLIEGKVVIDDVAGTIQVVNNGKVVAEIRQANDQEARSLYSYVGWSEPEDKERVERHIELFKNQVLEIANHWHTD